MEISRQEAAGALHVVGRAQAEVAVRRGYHAAEPHLIAWGALWVVGYTWMGLRPQAEWGWIWLPLDVIGIAASTLIGRHVHAEDLQRYGRQRGQGARVAAAVLAILAFMVATYVVFAPTTTAPYLAFPALLAGGIYVGMGVAGSRRLGWIGAAMFVLTMIGFLLFQPWLAFWLAAVGGGGLMLGGLWLRSA